MSDLSSSLEALALGDRPRPLSFAESSSPPPAADAALDPSIGGPLPAASYHDEAVFRRERERIFDRAPRYVGHELAVPEVGDFQTLAHEGDGRMLVRSRDGAGGVQLVSNVCRHRQAVMLRGRGNTGRQVVCPLHRWTYDASAGREGRLLGAPHFDHDPCLHLQTWPLQRWNGLLFESGGLDVAAELAPLAAAAGPKLDFSGFVLDHVEQHECDYNWKTFIEVYLEDYHVGPFHPGLGRFVDCDALAWTFGRHHSVQTVGIHKKLAESGSPVYRRWHDAVLGLNGGRAPEHGAVWLTLYPTVMVEWYPHVLVVSTLHARGPRRTTNVVSFFYPEEIAAFEREFVEAERAAYLETCREDDEIAERMDAGRLALVERGDDQAGPYQSPMEDGMRHFHDWYRRQMGWPGAAPARG